MPDPFACPHCGAQARRGARFKLEASFQLDKAIVQVLAHCPACERGWIIDCVPKAAYWIGEDRQRRGFTISEERKTA